MKTWKQIERSREYRLWIGQVIVPGGLALAAILSNPKTREDIGDAFNGAFNGTKNAVEKLFGKKKES